MHEILFSRNDLSARGYIIYFLFVSVMIQINIGNFVLFIKVSDHPISEFMFLYSTLGLLPCKIVQKMNAFELVLIKNN